jgi:uncharacterized protein (DUF1501 family)
MTMLTRRELLRSAPLLALAPSVPAFLASTARAAKAGPDQRVLIVLELEGGNDGINTVVPHADEGYVRHRKRLRLEKARLVKVDDAVGLHPSLTGCGKLLEAGRLAIVQGVGYPNPSRSHFRSMAIWQTAKLDAEEHKGTGWLGRGLDSRGDKGAAAQLIGAGPPPVALLGRRAIASTLANFADFQLPAGAEQIAHSLPAAKGADDLTAFVRRSLLDTCATADKLVSVARAEDKSAAYPGSDLAGRFRLIARLLKAGLGTRVYYTRHRGFDTHTAQLNTHANLLSTFDGALRAFFNDLDAAKLADRVAVLVFSEFGRTVKENGSAGTDHGTAGPVFLAGPGVKGGLVGRAPSLTDLDRKHGDLRVGIDFRRVYATVLDRWLGLPSREALGGAFEPLLLFKPV